MSKVKKEKKQLAFNCEIPVEKVGPNSLFLHQQFGKGTYGKTKFDAWDLMGSGLVITLNDDNNQRYIVRSQDIIKAVLEKATEGKK